jgi:hypothetical protein
MMGLSSVETSSTHAAVQDNLCVLGSQITQKVQYVDYHSEQCGLGLLAKCWRRELVTGDRVG